MKLLNTAVAACAICFSAGAGLAQEGAGGGAEGYRQTVFPSLSRAISAAEKSGMVLARDLFGKMRFVTPALAALLEQKGFRKDRRGVLLGYAPGASGQGLVFVASSPRLARDSYAISIEPAQPDTGIGTGTEAGGGCGEGDDCE